MLAIRYTNIAFICVLLCSCAVKQHSLQSPLLPADKPSTQLVLAEPVTIKVNSGRDTNGVVKLSFYGSIFHKVKPLLN